jgi:hypothetical protein
MYKTRTHHSIIIALENNPEIKNIKRTIETRNGFGLLFFNIGNKTIKGIKNQEYAASRSEYATNPNNRK